MKPSLLLCSLSLHLILIFLLAIRIKWGAAAAAASSAQFVDADDALLKGAKKRRGKGIKWTTVARAYGFSEKSIKSSTKRLEIPSACRARGGGSSSGESHPEEDFFRRFRTVGEIDEYVDYLVASYPNVAKIQRVGKSVEGRMVRALVLSAAKKKSGRSARRSMLITAAVHGREWTPVSAVLYAATKLLRGYVANKAFARSCLDNLELHIIPLVNPDGYAYTFTDGSFPKQKWQGGKLVEETNEARYWRKNRGRKSDGTLQGVDLNRNFGSDERVWGRDHKTKSMRLALADVYQGPEGFSEPESRNLNAYAKQLRKTLTAFFDVHCCIGAVLEPYSSSPLSPQHRAGIERVGKDIVASMSLAGKGVKTFVEGSGVPGAYEWRPRDYTRDKGSGLTGTWAFVEARVNLTYIAEVRGKFVIACWEIKNIGKEVLGGLLALSKHARVAHPHDWASGEEWPPAQHGKLEVGMRSETQLSFARFASVLSMIALAGAMIAAFLRRRRRIEGKPTTKKRNKKEKKKNAKRRRDVNE